MSLNILEFISLDVDYNFNYFNLKTDIYFNPFISFHSHSMMWHINKRKPSR